MKKDLETYLEAARVPDPGESYWKAFPGRVADRLDHEPCRRLAEPSTARKRLLPISLTAAVAALIMLISLFVGSAKAPRIAAGANFVVEDSKTTVLLARDSEPEGILQTLERVALEKVNRALAAIRAGDWQSVAPLARSYEKVLTGGLLPGIERALEDDEDLEETIPGLKEKVTTKKRELIRLTAAVRDKSSQESLESAIDASDTLLEVLEDRF